MLRKLSGPSIIVYSQPFDSFVLQETYKAYTEKSPFKNDHLKFVQCFWRPSGNETLKNP